MNDDVAARWESLDGPGAVHPWSGNPRVNAGAVAKIAESIVRWGFGAPIVARLEGGEIAAGHTRHKAARRLKGMWKALAKSDEAARARWHPDAVRVATKGEVPVRRVNLTEEQAHAYALADNKLMELSAWDPEALVKVMGDFDLDTITAAGWSQDDLQKLLGELAPDEEPSERDAGGQRDDSDKVATDFQVLITCRDEAHQREIIELAQEQGWTFRALV